MLTVSGCISNTTTDAVNAWSTDPKTQLLCVARGNPGTEYVHDMGGLLCTPHTLAHLAPSVIISACRMHLQTYYPDFSLLD